MCVRTQFSFFYLPLYHNQIKFINNINQIVRIAIGIDIGGTSTKIAIVNGEGQIIARKSLPMKNFDNEWTYFQALFKAIHSLLAYHSDEDVIGIGVGSPSCIPQKGIIKGAANLPFSHEVEISKILETEFDLPTFLVKDGNAAALGEGQFGAAKNMTNFIVLTLGTGLGCGIVVNDNIISGNYGQAGEFGHSIVKENGRMCGCGRKGCLETYVSATGIKRTLFKLLASSNAISDLRNVTFNQLTAKMISEAAQKGDVIAQAAFKQTGEILGKQLADLVTLFEPQAFFLAGGLAEAGDLLFSPTIKQMEDSLLNFYKNSIKVLPSALKTNESALLGPASLVWKNQTTFKKRKTPSFKY